MTYSASGLRNHVKKATSSDRAEIRKRRGIERQSSEEQRKGLAYRGRVFIVAFVRSRLLSNDRNTKYIGKIGIDSTVYNTYFTKLDRIFPLSKEEKEREREKKRQPTTALRARVTAVVVLSCLLRHFTFREQLTANER